VTGPACGNNPNHQLTDRDRQAVDSFRAYLATLASLRTAQHRLDQIRDAARLHRQQLVGTSELYAVIEADDVPPADQSAVAIQTVEQALAAEASDERALILLDALIVLRSKLPCTCARSQGLHETGCRRYVPGHDVLSPARRLARARAELRRMADETPAAEQPTTDRNSGPGWYEVITPRATTCIAYVHEDGSLYLPEGDALTANEFAFAAARGNAHRLVRADDQPAAGARQDGAQR
jgi:hypothetical protein